MEFSRNERTLRTTMTFPANTLVAHVSGSSEFSRGYTNVVFARFPLFQTTILIMTVTLFGLSKKFVDIIVVQSTRRESWTIGIPLSSSKTLSVCNE